MKQILMQAATRSEDKQEFEVAVEKDGVVTLYRPRATIWSIPKGEINGLSEI